MEVFLYQASIYLLAAVIAVPFAARLGLGSVLGYLAAGIAIGPVLHLVGSESQDLQHFAEFGVVMMLFLIGLELDPRALWNMRHRLIGLGGLQILLTIAAVTAGAMAMGYAWQTGVALGMILSLSSTAIVLQTLNEKKLMQTSGGRSAFSVLLTQDIAVIPMLAGLPLLAIGTVAFNQDGSITRAAPEEETTQALAPEGSAATGDQASAGTEAATGHATSGSDATAAGTGEHGEELHAAMSLVDGLPGWGVTLVTLGAVAAVILTGIYLTRPVFRYIHQARLREMYTAVALLIVVGIGLLMTLVGLSPALGTFLAGVVLANSEFRHELESDLEPFKGLLLGLFFITVGAGINFNVLLRDPVGIVGLTLALIAIKLAVLYALGRIFKLRRRALTLFTLSLAQAGEFGFVLTAFSVQQQVLPPGVSERLLLIIALSMLITPLLFILYEVLTRRIGRDSAPQEEDIIDETGPVIIAGIGRFGQIVNRLVRSVGVKTVVLDNDMRTIQLMRRFGFRGYFGDPTRPDLLHAAGLADASVLVVALDDPEAALKLVTHARQIRPDLHIVVRARDRTHVYRLYAAGANDIVRELFDSSLRAGRYVLENIGLSEFEASRAEETFYHHDRHTMRELAELFDPDIPAHENTAYVQRSRELAKELELALQEALEDDGKDAA